MTDKELTQLIEEAKEKEPKLVIFITDYLERKINLDEIEKFKAMTREEQDEYLEKHYGGNGNHD